MNMNNLGKALVMINLALSVVALTWAAGLFLQFRDFGWAEPRLEIDKRVASEYDKRVVAYNQAKESATGTLDKMNTLVAELHTARTKFAENQLIYRAELERLYSGVGKGLVFKRPRFKGGTLELLKGGRYNPPVIDDVIDGITKSYKGYKVDLADVETKIKTEIKTGEDWTAKHAIISKVLNGGKDDKTGDPYPGLYDLIEEEKRAQDEAKKELDYLEKIWAPVLQEAEIFIQRRVRLEKTLRDLRESRMGKKAKS